MEGITPFQPFVPRAKTPRRKEKIKGKNRNKTFVLGFNLRHKIFGFTLAASRLKRAQRTGVRTEFKVKKQESTHVKTPRRKEKP